MQNIFSKFKMGGRVFRLFGQLTMIHQISKMRATTIPSIPSIASAKQCFLKLEKRWDRFLFERSKRQNRYFSFSFGRSIYPYIALKAANWILFATFISILCGCGSSKQSSNEASEEISIDGRVYLGNQPMAGGTIVFITDRQMNTAADLIIGHINRDGSFHILNNPESPIQAGRYHLTITEVVDQNSSFVGQEVGNRSPHSHCPDRYRNPDLANLHCELKPGKNMCEIILPEN